MSRCGYIDDIDQRGLAMWRGRVASAIRGKRGQAMLRKLRDAMDAIPDKWLTRCVLMEKDGTPCALGLALRSAGIADTELIGMEGDDHEWIAERLNVASCLVQELEYLNDDFMWVEESDEARWRRMRKLVDDLIRGDT